MAKSKKKKLTAKEKREKQKEMTMDVANTLMKKATANDTMQGISFVALAIGLKYGPLGWLTNLLKEGDIPGFTIDQTTGEYTNAAQWTLEEHVQTALLETAGQIVPGSKHVVQLFGVNNKVKETLKKQAELKGLKDQKAEDWAYAKAELISWACALALSGLIINVTKEYSVSELVEAIPFIQ